jgi:hypothetical protein
MIRAPSSGQPGHRKQNVRGKGQRCPRRAGASVIPFLGLLEVAEVVDTLESNTVRCRALLEPSGSLAAMGCSCGHRRVHRARSRSAGTLGRPASPPPRSSTGTVAWCRVPADSAVPSEREHQAPLSAADIPRRERSSCCTPTPRRHRPRVTSGTFGRYVFALAAENIVWEAAAASGAPFRGTGVVKLVIRSVSAKQRPRRAADRSPDERTKPQKRIRRSVRTSRHRKHTAHAPPRKTGMGRKGKRR